MPEPNPDRLTVDQLDAIFAASPYYHELDDDDPENFDGDEQGILYPLRDGSAVRIDWRGNLTHITSEDEPAFAPEGEHRQSVMDRIHAMADAAYMTYLRRNPLG